MQGVDSLQLPPMGSITAFTLTPVSPDCQSMAGHGGHLRARPFLPLRLRLLLMSKLGWLRLPQRYATI